MAFEVEAWWSANFNKYSIRDLQRLPIFHRFVQIHYPFERADDNSHEKFYVERGEVDIFEWTDKRSKRFERFWHDRKRDHYHYELNYTDADSPVIIRSWLAAEIEWGEIIRNFGTFELHEGWRLEPPNRTYERFTIEQGIKKGFRAGIHPFRGDYERWVEDFWEFSNEKIFKKQWYKEGESGGETTNHKGEYTWGENWFSNSKRYEKKCWHKDGEHQWGHDFGKEPAKRWDHAWDFNPEDKYEEKVTVNNGRDIGYRFWGSKGDWYKQEWEGLKMLEREDRCEEVVSSKIRERLDTLYTREYNSDLKQQQTLNMLALYHPAFQDRVKALENRINDVQAKDRGSVENLLDSIDALRTVGDDQEDLTLELFRAFRDDFNTLQEFNHYFIKSLEDSLQTLERIGTLVQDNGPYQDWVPKVQEFKDMPLGTILKGKTGMKLLTELEKTKYDELLRFRGGIPREELENAMELLYEVMVKHDAVSDKIVELTRADDFKGKLDGMEEQFGDIHQKFLEEGDPNKLKEMLSLLLDYQPIHLDLMNRLRGYTREESMKEAGNIDSALQETKSAPSLKNTRAKVRSGRPPRETPFQTMEHNLNAFVPALQRLLEAVDAPQSELEKLQELASKNTADGEPVNVIVDKTRLLAEIAEGSIPAVDTHEATVRESDEALNSFFDSDKGYLELMGEGDLLQKRQGLVEQSKGLKYLPRLVRDKTLSLNGAAPALNAFINGKLKQLGELLEKTRKMDDELGRFFPEYDFTLRSVGAPDDTRLPVSSPPTAEDTADSVLLKINTLNSVAAAAHNNVEDNDRTLKETDALLNQAFEDEEKSLVLIGDTETVERRKPLIARTPLLVYLAPLILEKTKTLKGSGAAIGDQIQKLQEMKEKLRMLNEMLGDFLPLYNAAMTSLGVPESVRAPLLEQINSPMSSDNPADNIAVKIAALKEVARASVPSVEDHDSRLRKIDENLNRALEASFADLEKLENGPGKVAAAKQLIEKTPGTSYFPPLLQEKSEALSQNSGQLGDFYGKYFGMYLDAIAKMGEARGDLNKFIPLYISSLRAVGSPQSIIDAAESLKVEQTDNEPEAVLNQARGLRLVGASEQAPIEEHDRQMKDTDAYLNQALEAGLEELGYLDDGALLADKHRSLISASASTEYFNPLLNEKSKALAETLPRVNEFTRRKVAQNADNLKKVPIMGNFLLKFIPLFKAHIVAVNAPEEYREKLDVAGTFPENFDDVTLGMLEEKVVQVYDSAVGAEPSLNEHVESIKKSDANINQYFEETFPQYEIFEGAQENIIEPRKALIARSEEPYLVPVVLAKTEELAAHTSEMLDYLHQTEETTTTTTTQIDELTTELANRSLIIEDLRKKIKELERLIAIKDEELEVTRTHKPLLDQALDDAAAAKRELHDVKIANGELSQLLQQARDEIDRITPELNELRDFKTRSLDMVLENERLKSIIKSYDDVMGDKKAQFDDIVIGLQNEISGRDKQIRDLLDEINRLKAEIALIEKNRRRQLMLRVISALATTLKAEKTDVLLHWLFFANQPEEMPPNSIMDEVDSVPLFDEELEQEPRFKETEAPLVAERVSQLPQNCILSRFWKVSGGRFDKPATPMEAIPFWDEMIGNFYESAKEDFANKRRPLIFPEFTLERLFKALATRVSVGNRLGVHIPTLYRLYNAGHPFAKVVVRMLNLFNGSPAPLAGQLVVAIFKPQFEELATAYENECKATNPLQASDLAISGGMARLDAVLSRFSGLFENPAFVIEHWLRHLKPSGVSLSDFVLFVVHRALRNAGIDQDVFWVDVHNGEGAIDSEKFANAAHGPSKISKRLLREATKRHVSREHFSELQSVNEEEYVVNKGSFLLGILEAYLAGVRRFTVELTEQFTASGLTEANSSQFIQLANALDPAASAEVLGKVYEEGLTISSSQAGLDLGAYVRVLLRYAFAKFSAPPFAVDDLSKFTDVHPREYDWLEGKKMTVMKTTKTVITTSKVRIVKKS